MDMILQGIPGVLCYLDDLLIVGKTREEHIHISTMEEVLKCLQNEGLKLSKDKYCFLVKAMEYIGFKIDANALHATGQMLDALLKAPIPTSVQQLRSFLGLVNYYSKFIPNLATLLQPLNALLKKNAQWKWSEECDKEVKQRFTSLNVLINYDPSLPIRLARDVSEYGIGAVISHRLADGSERLIAFAS